MAGRPCKNCGGYQGVRYVEPLAQYVCAECERKWNNAHIAINHDPVVAARRNRHHGDAWFAEHEYRAWWRGERREER